MVIWKKIEDQFNSCESAFSSEVKIGSATWDVFGPLEDTKSRYGIIWRGVIMGDRTAAFSTKEEAKAEVERFWVKWIESAGLARTEI